MKIIQIESSAPQIKSPQNKLPQIESLTFEPLLIESLPPQIESLNLDSLNIELMKQQMEVPEQMELPQQIEVPEKMEPVKQQIEVPEFNLGKRDQQLMQIEAQIEDKRKWLLNKRKVLKKKVKENKFLEGVKNDYEKYHNFIVNQKQGQLKAMGLLNQYIGDIIVSGKLTEKDIQQTKHEQNEILGQIDKIKSDLDEIMKEE
jgi:hypothetical protein